MSLSDLSIKRPVLASVMSMLIIVFGVASLLRLPLRELPDVDTSVVTVTTGRYLGTSDGFDKAMARYAETYADQNDRDYAARKLAVDSGKITAENA